MCLGCVAGQGGEGLVGGCFRMHEGSIREENWDRRIGRRDGLCRKLRATAVDEVACGACISYDFGVRGGH